MSALHVPVLLDEVYAGLNVQQEGKYVDATYGRGGHTQRILDGLSAQGHLWVIDRDPEAIEHARCNYNDPRVTICSGSFAQLDTFLQGTLVDGILFDFGVSSTQLDDSSRGFSFRNEALLDMRFDQDKNVPVHVWLNTATYQDIADVLHFYGEEPLARGIARAIVRRRAQAPITKTTDLANIVASVVHRKFGDSKIHPATRTFQALRIFINDELGHVEKALLQSGHCLRGGGRLVCLTFHGLETRMVKSLQRNEPLLQGGERPTVHYRTMARNMADAWEKRDNPRARSAQLMVLEKVA